MQNPASPPKPMHTCPTCKKPVEPGYTFCEACGTHITELSTCSKCGTQFISQNKFCDLCGAPLIHGKVPEGNEENNIRTVEEQAPEHDEGKIPEPVTDEEPEDDEEADTGTDEELVPKDNEEEIPEQELDKVPEDNEEDRVSIYEKTPHHASGKNKEPYTDALLKEYGAEYSDEETVGSQHNQKSEPVDDALFFSHKKQGIPAKKRAGTIRIIGGVVILVALIAAIYFFGLPMLNGDGGSGILGNPPILEITPTPVPSSVVVIQPVPIETTPPVSLALVPLPTQLVPSDQKFYFQVRKNPVTLKISVIFTGSAGVDGIESADVKITHPDGAVSTGIIQPLKGQSEITLAGSKEADRVIIIARMYSGETYRVYDDLVSV